MTRVPILVVGGFLGSGKTTLVRHLLLDAQARGVRMAVVSNEFGALGIDAALLGTGAGRMVELAGGCVCCQLSEELVDTLGELHRNIRPDRIVIECSGLALPFDTQLHLYRPPVRDWLGDEACVVVVDAERWDEADPLFAEQVESADLVVLNKCDLVDVPVHARARARIAEIAPDAPILGAVFGAVPVDLLFPRGPRGPGLVGHDHDHDRDHARNLAIDAGHTHGDDPHGAWISFEVRLEAGIGEEVAEARLRSYGAARIKGFIQTDRGVRVVQGVGRRLELTPPDGEVDDALLGRVVLIRRRTEGGR